MYIPNVDATRGANGVLTNELQLVIIDILTAMTPHAKAFFDSKTYIAIEDLEISAPDDFGLSRASAMYVANHTANPLYVRKWELREDLAGIPDTICDTATISLAVNIPRIGVISATAHNVNVKSGTFEKKNVSVTLEGAVGFLWFSETQRILLDVLSKNLLGSPTFQKQLVD